jgi:hypothetical protein
VRVDLSPLLAEIECLFRILAFHHPNENWGWWHPTLIAWSMERGYPSHHHYDAAALVTIKRSLEKKLCP